MNILHHKSYHVYNKKNIEKVKADEAKADAKASADRERVQLAESEVRLKLLREKANAKLPNNEPTGSIQHVNFFQDIGGKNEEHEAEEKKKEDEFDRKTTMYLVNEPKKEDEPWYIKQDKHHDKYTDIHVSKRKGDKDSKRRKRDPIKLLDDPLDIITKKLHKKKDSSHSNRKEKHKSSSSTSSTTIEQLRSKRLEREKSEKMRVKQLYLGPNEELEEQEETNDRKRGYNSQFNRLETAEAKKRRRYH